MLTNKEIVEKFFYYGYDINDFVNIKNLVSNDYIDHSPAGAKGNMGAIDIFRIIHNSFNDMHVKILDLIEENDKVAGRFHFRGVQTKEYMRVKPTGKIVEWDAIEIFRIENGKIVESWGYWPDADILKKLAE